MASDHAGVALKTEVRAWLEALGYGVVDLGPSAEEGSVDYPDRALTVAQEVAAGKAQLGVLICGTGIGMSIAANKVPGIRAALCESAFAAAATRAHNDANILCLGARILGLGLAKEVVEAFFSSTYEAGRHARRVAKIGEIEARA